MKITKENLDVLDDKRDRRHGLFRRFGLALLKIFVFVEVAIHIFGFQIENASHHYLLYGFVNKFVPSLSLILYKIIVTVFICGVILYIFIAGKKIEKKICSNNVKYKISFDEESTVQRFLHMVERIITLLNLLFSVIIAMTLYFKVFKTTQYMDEMIFCAIFCGVIFFVLLHLFCKYGHLKERFIINPFSCIFIYVFYLVFLAWLIYLTSVAAFMAFIELLSGVFLLFVIIFIIRAWGSFWGLFE